VSSTELKCLIGALIIHFGSAPVGAAESDVVNTSIEKLHSALLFLKNLVINSQVLQTDYLYSKLFIMALCVVVIVFTFIFFRSKLLPVRFMTTTRLSIMDKVVQRACRYIEKNYTAQDLTVQKMCEELVVGTSFLEALFQKELGMSVNDFLNQVRINHVKLLLCRNSQMQLDLLTSSTGFSDVESCLKVFRKVTGADLEDYRESILSGEAYAKGLKI